MTEARGYVRLSQTGRDESISGQIQAIREYAAERDIPLTEADIYNDGEETSGFDADRDAFVELREELIAGEIDIIITRDRARLSRDFDTRIRLLTEFRDTGTEWHVVEERGPVGLGDEQTAGVEAINAAMDHYKKMQEIERSRQAIQEKQERGDDLGRPRFGMEYSEDSRRQVPGDEFDTVMEILSMRNDGASYEAIKSETGVSLGTISRVLDRREWYAERAKLGEA